MAKLRCRGIDAEYTGSSTVDPDLLGWMVRK